MIGRSHILLAACLAAFAAYQLGHAQGFDAGVQDQKNEQAHVTLARIEAVKPVQAELDRRIKAHFETLNSRASAMREVRLETETIRERDVYRNVCVDADGVRLLDRAADIANGSADLAGRAGRAAADPEGTAQAGRHYDRGGVPGQP